MTANSKPEPDSGPHPYFMAIEEIFLELRGAPLQLSPKDWQVAKGWHEKGIPLELVDRTMRELFERRRARDDDDKVWSLGLCKRSVEAAWRRRQKLEAPGSAGEAETVDLAARLARLAAALPADVAEHAAVAERIRALDGEAAAIEDQLAALDAEIFRRACDDLADAERRHIEGEITASLRALAARLPAEELVRAGTRLREELLRRHLGLPVLSLFAPEALAPSG